MGSLKVDGGSLGTVGSGQGRKYQGRLRKNLALGIGRFEEGFECGTGTTGRRFLREGLGKDSQSGKIEEEEGMSLNV